MSNIKHVLKRLTLGKLKHNLNFPSATRKIKKLKNKEKGRKCVILCNGPSLMQTDFDLLNASDTVVIGLNKINLLMETRELRCDYICAINRFVIEQNKDYYESTQIPVLLDSKVASDEITNSTSVIPIHALPYIIFSENLTEGYYTGYTVTYLAMQLAFYLGCSEVTLVGCDHNFVEKGKNNSQVNTKGGDQSHFIKGYFKEGQTWQLPDLPMSEVSYMLAKIHFENSDKILWNSTQGGKLELLPRIPLEEFLSKTT